MNVDTLNSKYKVVSKYFAGKTAMDESLTDFKEKKSFKVAKNNKAIAAKPKARKVKRVKGQKDIRTALKQKKNELVAYSKDFDNVCKKSGIDVDSEQLQLAIALSRSLQTSESNDSPTNSTKSLTTQQRTGLIRTTLKEYGFKVPEKPNASKKTKKRRKPYKLLLTSDDEKQQIIADKYSQLLFGLNNLQPTTSEEDLIIPNLFIYNMATNIEYENIKEDSIFYVDGLIEKTPNTVGSLLKNWSDIPGRPVSPEIDKSELIFSEVECSQEELNIVLSGPIKCSKDILQKKTHYKHKRSFTCYTDDKNIYKLGTIQTDPVRQQLSPDFLEECNDSTGNIISSLKPESPSVEREIEEQKLLATASTTQPSRSLSPDLFDDGDEIDDTMVETNEIMPNNQNKLVDNVTKGASEIMDLTECVNHFSQKNRTVNKDLKIVSQLSQVNETRRKSNDFMEITECVGSSEAVLDRIDEEIDLTEHSGSSVKDNSPDNIETKEYDGDSSQYITKKTDECIDLTPYCGKNIETNNRIGSNLKTTESVDSMLLDKASEPIDLTEHCVRNSDNSENVNTEEIQHMDLTQSSNASTDSLPFVHISGKGTVPDTSLDETIIMNENDYLETNTPVVDKEYQSNHENSRSPIANIEINNSGNEVNEDCYSKTNAGGALNIIPPLIMSPETNEIPTIDLDETEKTVEMMQGDIDLTQSSDSKELSESILNNTGRHMNNSDLGKKDDVSVDYDEALENMNSFPYYTNDENDDDNTEQNHSQEINEKDDSSSRQAVLELSDNELTSPSKPNIAVEDNNFDFGGISIIDNLPSFNRRSRSTMNSIPNGSMSDSLPFVNVRGRSPDAKSETPIKILVPNDDQRFANEILSSSVPQTPQERVQRHLDAETPQQSEYIVKTDNVTPILNYASMSTPERNKELDKYGLKPFKRKRAIQLLTHLYNQTHPYVESTDEVTSPSKKRRKENLSQPSPSKTSSKASVSPRNKSLSPRTKSPRKASKSPRKNSKSPRKQTDNCGDSIESDKENELFSVTSEVPAIRHIECDTDDWVFQKREKAKLHSCRVPLHIAFHNYVSCRRRLYEAILRYEPVNIDVIHKELAASGHRYDPKDLLKFMDKRCITVKTADNTKNNKRY